MGSDKASMQVLAALQLDLLLAMGRTCGYKDVEALAREMLM
jgi:hypothetical protein